MLHFSPGVAGGFAVGAAAAAAALFTLATATHPAPLAKAERLPAIAPALPGEKRVAVVEVVGVHDAAIVYRDRDGRLLFSTDPVANVTVVAKNLILPEVTIRDSAESQVERVPLEKTRSPNGDRSPLWEGCETGLSPDISPTFPVTKGRCVVELTPLSDVAALR